MRRLLIFSAALIPVLLLLALAVSSNNTASADAGIHIKGWGATPNDCASCHRAHRGQAPLLLTQAQTALCNSCHGNSASGSTLNVVAGTNEADGGALRGGGFSTARIDTNDPTGISPDTNPKTILALPAVSAQPTASKHQVGSVGTAWGYGAYSATADAGLVDFDLECGSCHDPHGNGYYRVLRPIPSGVWSSRSAAPSWATKIWNDANANGKIDSGETVYLADENPKVYSTTDYWPVENYTDRWVDSTLPVDNVDTETTGRRVGLWCTTCHTRYLAPSGAYDVDSGDAVFKYRHATDPSTRHASGTTVPTNPATLSGSCLKCHVSHGTNAVVGGASATEEWPDNTVNNPLAGDSTDSRLLRMDGRGVCQKCHNK